MKRRIVLYVFVFGFTVTAFGCGQGSTTAPSPVVIAKPIVRESANSFSEAMITFSFDDGRVCAFNNAIPVLDSVGFKSTDFIITQRLIGTDDYITASNVLSLETRGHEIGNHTRTHPDLTTLSQDNVQNEVDGARQDLLNIGVRKVETLAYPFGAYNNSLEGFISTAGYLGARSTDDGNTTPSTNRFILKRRNLGGNVTISDVQNWINTAITNKEWLILTSHHVDYLPNEYSITPELWKQIVDIVVSKSIRVVTISDGLKAM